MSLCLPHVSHYRCAICGAQRSTPGLGWCDVCGPLGTLSVHYDFDAVRARLSPSRLAADPRPGVERYAALLPLPVDAKIPPLPVWRTPVVRGDRLGWGPGRLWIKDDSRLPSSSFKDRATFVAVSQALSSGARGIVCASTGNAASSLAAFAAASGLEATILVPASAPRPKLAQVLMSGAHVVPVDGTYDDAFELSLELAVELDLPLRSTGVNPYLAEGKKTSALEIAEQFAWDPPEVVAVSAGDGCIISGLAKGFADLEELGWIPRRPQLIGVQAEGSAALTRAFEAGLARPEPIVAKTIADSISVGLPRDGAKALAAVRGTPGGRFVTVTDAEILLAMRALAERLGVFAEPAGATAYAGLAKLRASGELGQGRVLAVNTGSMLKDTRSALAALGGLPVAVSPRLDAVLAALEAPR